VPTVVPPWLTLEHLPLHLDRHSCHGLRFPETCRRGRHGTHFQEQQAGKMHPLYLIFIGVVASPARDGVASGMASQVVEEGMARPGGGVWTS
jgi:hypothetical protein